MTQGLFPLPLQLTPHQPVFGLDGVILTRCSFGTNPDPTPSRASGDGYWVLGADGGVFSFGSAQFYGSTGGMKLNRPVTGMAVIRGSGSCG